MGNIFEYSRSQQILLNYKRSKRLAEISIKNYHKEEDIEEDDQYENLRTKQRNLDFPLAEECFEKKPKSPSNNRINKIKFPLNSENNPIENDIKLVFQCVKHIQKVNYNKKDKATGVITKSITLNDYENNFYKNEKQIRETYLEKLITKRIWNSQNKKISNTLFIFDWDDTLICTSFLGENKNKRLELIIERLLNMCLEKGEVFIITNAEEGWVEYSSSRYYPNLKEIFERIKVISARSKYENKFPNDIKLWKFQTFLDVTLKMNKEMITNIICLGDSQNEIEAANLLGSKFKNSVVKTVKFKKFPKSTDLIKQLTTVCNQFDEIYSSSKNTSYALEMKKNKSI